MGNLQVANTQVKKPLRCGLLEVQLQLPRKTSTKLPNNIKGAAPLATIFQVSAPKNINQQINVKWQTQKWFPRILGRSDHCIRDKFGHQVAPMIALLTSSVGFELLSSSARVT